MNTSWSGTVAATKRVSDGEVYDLVIIGSSNIDQLIAAWKLAAGSRADFAKSGVGIAIRAGLSKPDVSTSDALKPPCWRPTLLRIRPDRAVPMPNSC